mmetsp:Transcript_40807/g.89228  ORF Transcript_40807/g.89228 Transcript_40807/m.89228 type:complete len:559 (-) Transcript_40807:115-1791(-)
MADEVLEKVGDVSALSFYGLSRLLEKVSELIDRADHAAVSKVLRAEDQGILDRKDDILEAQSTLRREMGKRLEEPSLTRREKVLAKDFLSQQLKKLQVSSGDARVQKAVERLQKLQADVESQTPRPDSKEVLQLELSIKELEAEWKELQPLHAKWEAGKKSFPSNTELQAFLRRCKDCEKGRDAKKEALEKALCAFRDERAAAQYQKQTTMAKGWTPAAKPAPVRPRDIGARPPPAVKRPAKPSAWGSTAVNFAQRMRAELVAKVREEVAPQASEEEEEEEVAPPRPIVPKKPPPLPPAVSKAKSPPAVVEAEVDDFQDEEAEPPTASSASVSAAPKKKGKAGKKKGIHKDIDLDDLASSASAVPVQRGSSVAQWVVAAEAAMRGSVIQKLLRPQAWSPPKSEEMAAERLEELTSGLPVSNSLGLELPMEWAAFAGLEVDFGPISSRRGTPAWVLRLQANVPELMPHYLAILFALLALHTFSHFGLLAWVLTAQVVLILAPSDMPYLQGTARIFSLQIAHVLLWLCFLRSCWLTHVLIKLLVVLLVAGHAVSVKLARG